MARVCKNMFGVASRRKASALEPVAMVSGRTPAASWTQSGLGSWALPQDSPLSMPGIDLGVVSPQVKHTKTDEPMWHLIRRFQDHGHLLNVGLDVTALVLEHGVSPAQSSLSDMPFNAAPSSSPSPAVAPSTMACGSDKADLVQASSFSVDDKHVPLDYWQTYESHCEVTR